MIIVITNNTSVSPNVHSVFLFPAMFYFSSPVCCLLMRVQTRAIYHKGSMCFLDLFSLQFPSTSLPSPSAVVVEDNRSPN